MIEQNFSDLLIKFGITKEVADKLEDSINGKDLTNLVNALTGDYSNLSIANKILSKYGVQITNTVNEDNNFKLSNNLVFENLKEIIFNDILDEDYQYITNVTDRYLDTFIDYLDDLGINYFYDGGSEFKINCLDRNQAYKIDNFISTLKPKGLRDSTNPENKMRNKKINESSVLVNPDVIQMASRAGLSMKSLVEALDDLDIDTAEDFDVDGGGDLTSDYDFSSPEGDFDVDVTDDSLPVTDDSLDVSFDDGLGQDELIDDGIDSVYDIDDSDVLTSVTNSISDITNNLGNLKVSEYKTVIDSLQALLDTARASGRTYLGD